MRIAIIGAGISGLTAARLLNKDHSVVVFEKDSKPGGLIKCERINGNLFHTCGGHVLNSKKEEVLNWLWNIFDKNKEFTMNDRNSIIFMDKGQRIPYPIENHAYLFDDTTLKKIIDDLIFIAKQNGEEPRNFEEFLKRRFGQTLYDLYFHPYNKKIWRMELNTVPLTWLEGKLPMPSVQEIIYNNIRHIEEKKFVHSRFYYEKSGGSQFIANRLAEELDIRYNKTIERIEYTNQRVWNICGEPFDCVIFCGSIKQLPSLIKGVDIQSYTDSIDALKYHGTTSVFCQIDKTPYSWIYLPNKDYDAHRIICTGNFSSTNNANGITTGTVEFTDYISEEEIKRQLPLIPLHPKYITHKYNKFTYPIQDAGTRTMVKHLKEKLSSSNFYFTGRFADWEYYNMDIAIYAAMETVKAIKGEV